jgi:alpha/beta hydrolase fold
MPASWILDLSKPAPPPALPAILLHGWPYDIHRFVDVAPLLAAAGYRVIVPYLRGYGSTRFLSSETFRNAQPSAVALDIVALMPSGSEGQSSPVLIGERGRSTSSRRFGRSAARRWCPWAVIWSADYFYDVLRGLDYFRSAAALPDERMAEAIDIVRAKPDTAGRWPLENPHPGELHFEIDEGDGKPSRWNTLRAMRVLRWYEEPSCA